MKKASSSTSIHIPVAAGGGLAEAACRGVKAYVDGVCPFGKSDFNRVYSGAQVVSKNDTEAAVDHQGSLRIVDEPGLSTGAKRSPALRGRRGVGHNSAPNLRASSVHF